MSGHLDTVSAIDLMKAGAKDILIKPFRMQALIDSVQKSISLYSKKLNEIEINKKNTITHNEITKREKEILKHITNGKTTKEISLSLSISPNTVENHRSSIMKKLSAKSTGHLVKIIIENKQLEAYIKEQ